MTDKIKQCGNCELYGICLSDKFSCDIIMDEDEGTECHIYKERNNGN